MIVQMLSVVFSLLLLLISANGSSAFGPAEGCATSAGCESGCDKCHTLSNEEVARIFNSLNIQNAKILDIKLSPVKSLWEISLESAGRRGVVYVDYSKKYLISGSVIEISTKSNTTAELVQKLEDSRRIDVSKIPLENALVMGDKNAAKRVIVFTDPDCPFCARLHQELKNVLEKRKDIVFYIKLFPLPMHKDAYWKAKSIECGKSLKMLEDNFDKKQIEKKECDTKEIDNNLKLGESLGISGTPTLVFSDGKVRSGAMPADKIIELAEGK